MFSVDLNHVCTINISYKKECLVDKCDWINSKIIILRQKQLGLLLLLHSEEEFKYAK